MKNKRKINLLFRVRSMEMGGVQKVLLEYLKNLSREKYNIAVMLNLHQGELKNEIPNDVQLVYFAEGTEDFSNNPIIHRIQKVIRRLRLMYLLNFQKIVYKKLINQPDIEISLSTYTFGESLKSPIKSSKKVAWLHGDIRNVTFTERENKMIVDLMLKFDAQLFVSEQSRKVFREYSGNSIPNSEVIYNPFDTALIIQKSKEKISDFPGIPVLVAAGRLIKIKNYHSLVSAHKKLIDKGIYHQILLLGDGPEFQNLANQIHSLDVENTFKLLGQIENPYPYFSKADLYVHPSTTEAYPLVIAENLILGTPIISTNVGGISEMMEHEINGLFVEPTVESLAAAMERMLTDNNLMNKIIENNENLEEKFSATKIYDKFDNLLKNTIVKS